MVKAAIKLTFTEKEWKAFKEENSKRKLLITGQKKINQFKAETSEQQMPAASGGGNPLAGGIFSKFLPSAKHSSVSPAQIQSQAGEKPDQSQQDKAKNSGMSLGAILAQAKKQKQETE